MVTAGILPFRENSHGRAGNRTRDLMISSQRLWPLDHEVGQLDNKMFNYHWCTAQTWRRFYLLPSQICDSCQSHKEFIIFNKRFCPAFSCQDINPYLGSSTLTSLWQCAIKSAVAMFSNRCRYETRLKRCILTVTAAQLLRRTERDALTSTLPFSVY